MYIGSWFIPLALTLFCVGMMFRPIQTMNSSVWSVDAVCNSIEAAARLFWLIPVGFIWAIYFFILWMIA